MSSVYISGKKYGLDSGLHLLTQISYSNYQKKKTLKNTHTKTHAYTEKCEADIYAVFL